MSTVAMVFTLVMYFRIQTSVLTHSIIDVERPINLQHQSRSHVDQAATANATSRAQQVPKSDNHHHFIARPAVVQVRGNLPSYAEAIGWKPREEKPYHQHQQALQAHPSRLRFYTGADEADIDRCIVFCTS